MILDRAMRAAVTRRGRGWGARPVLCLLALFASSCVVVPQNRRRYLADPLMTLDGDTLEGHKRQKFYSTREAAAGGDGVPAGGGCGCQ